MKRLLPCLCVWLLAATLALAGPLKIIGPQQADPYKIVELQADGDLTGAAVIWDVAPEDLADVRELAGGKLLFVAPPGSYRIKARVVRIKDGAVTIDSSRTNVVIGVPVPPVPPIPPDPPTPPVAPLTKELQATYDADPSPAKAQHRAALASLYKTAAYLTDNQTLATWGDLSTRLQQAGAAMTLSDGSLLPKDALKGVRTKLGTDLVGVFGSSPATPLTPVNRAAAAALLTRYGAALEGVR